MLIVFSTGTPGLTPGYTILNADKSVHAARTTVGITDLSGGEYGVEVSDATLAGRVVMWDTGETVPRYATEMFAFTSEALDIAAITDYLAIATGGPGAIPWPYTLTTDGSTPIPDAKVWVTSDIEGETVVTSGRTDNFGVLTPVPQLDAGTYYFWSKKSGMDFDNPDTEVVA